jgi:flagellar hook-basal body complex protein FliE
MDPVMRVDENRPIMNAARPRNGSRQQGFVEELRKVADQVDNRIKEADRRTQSFVAGERYDIHEVMIATEKAHLSFRFLLQIRNKLLDAYQEIMRMQV